MTLGEGSIIEGSGIHTYFTRWGDYTSMNIDPTDDCTFWYVGEYIVNSGPPSALWQTRIASFTLPGCPSNGGGSKSSKSKTYKSKGHKENEIAGISMSMFMSMDFMSLEMEDGELFGKRFE